MFSHPLGCDDARASGPRCPDQQMLGTGVRGEVRRMRVWPQARRAPQAARRQEFASGNISHAARLAKKNRRAFFELIKKHHIDVERFRSSG
jgi:hypothetical protein